MKILYILNGLGFATNVSLGGSDKRALEIAKRLARRKHKIAVLTTSSGARLLEKNLSARYFVIYEPWFLRSDLRNSFIGRVLAYFYATFVGCFYCFGETFDIVFPTSDFFFDLLPAISCKKRRYAPKMVSIVHHAICQPFKRKGEILKDITLFIIQRISFILMTVFSDRIFVYATKEGEKIREILKRFGSKPSTVCAVICGIDTKKMENVPCEEKRFAACFIGGLRPAKGLKDIVPIWRKVCATSKESRLFISGSGLTKYTAELKNEINRYKLENNIVLNTGHLDQPGLYKNLASSRLLMLPSYEEGWSIITFEALSLGVPAVVYDLDVFEIFSDAIVKVRVGDTDGFARALLGLLNNQDSYEQLKSKGISIAKKFDWDAACGLDERLLSEVIK
jgi:glycosyltransferase involved in cell wall biosynthesis